MKTKKQRNKLKLTDKENRRAAAGEGGWLLGEVSKTGEEDQKQQTSLGVQWLGLRAPRAGALGSIPHQGTRSHTSQLKIVRATTKAWHSQMSKQNVSLKKDILQVTK